MDGGIEVLTSRHMVMGGGELCLRSGGRGTGTREESGN